MEMRLDLRSTEGEGNDTVRQRQAWPAGAKRPAPQLQAHFQQQQQRSSQQWSNSSATQAGSAGMCSRTSKSMGVSWPPLK